MQTHNLDLITRATGKAGQKSKQDNDVYGVVYGHGLEPMSVKGDRQTISRLFDQAGTSQIINLKVNDEQPRQVLLKETDFDPITGKLRHFDLYAIKKGEKIDVEVPVELIGESPALKIGLLLHQLIDSIEVRTTPDNIPEHFEVDVSAMSEVGDTIHVSDLEIGEDLEIDEDLLEQPIVKVDALQLHEEPEIEETTDETAEVPSEHGGDDELEGESKDEEGSKN